jgi:hypothetical protein
MSLIVPAGSKPNWFSQPKSSRLVKTAQADSATATEEEKASQEADGEREEKDPIFDSISNLPGIKEQFEPSSVSEEITAPEIPAEEPKSVGEAVSDAKEAIDSAEVALEHAEKALGVAAPPEAADIPAGDNAPEVAAKADESEQKQEEASPPDIDDVSEEPVDAVEIEIEAEPSKEESGIPGLKDEDEAEDLEKESNGESKTGEAALGFVKLGHLSPDVRKKVADYWTNDLGFPPEYVKLMVADYE